MGGRAGPHKPVVGHYGFTGAFGAPLRGPAKVLLTPLMVDFLPACESVFDHVDRKRLGRKLRKGVLKRVAWMCAQCLPRDAFGYAKSSKPPAPGRSDEVRNGSKPTPTIENRVRLLVGDGNLGSHRDANKSAGGWLRCLRRQSVIVAPSRSPKTSAPF